MIVDRRRQTLDPGEVHLWYVRHEAITDESLLAAYRDVLSAEERAHLERLEIPRVHHEYLVARSFVRDTLSRYTGVDPREWTFSTNAYGRPQIAGPTPGPTFNLSHTYGLMAIVVAEAPELGVDVEAVDRRGHVLDIAEDFFSPAEVAELFSQPRSARRDRFFDYWTLKESYIKACGAGLSLPLDRFTFRIGARYARIEFEPEFGDVPDGWRFWRLFPDSTHRGAVAVRGTGDNPDPKLVEHETVPMSEPRA